MSQSIETRTDRQVDVRTPAGETSGSVTLPGELFDANANVSLMHQVVVAQLAAARQGTHSTKTRGQVSGGGAKPYRQKGTGRARQGSTRAPQFAGGGIGPRPARRATTRKKTPKKMKAAALRGALSDRAREGRVHVVSAFVDGDAPKTKAALATLDPVTQAKRVLVVLDRDDVLNWVSLRNAPQVHLIEAGQLNTYDVLVADEVVFTETALAEYVAGPAKGKRAPSKPDLATHLTPGGIPSIAPAEGEGTVETATAAEAPAKKAAAKKAPAKKAAADEGRGRRGAAEKAAAKKAAAKKAPAAEAAAADETTEEKA